VTPSSHDGAPHAIVGRVRRAHGIRGEVVVQLLTDAPDAIFAPGARVLAGTIAGDLGPKPSALHVENARAFKEGLLVTFQEIVDRTQAELWRDRYLLVPSEELEAPDDDEVYLHDLVGLQVERLDGSVIGTVIGYYDLAHGILLEIQRTADTVLLPYRDEFVAAVEVGARRLVVDPPEGLFE